MFESLKAKRKEKEILIKQIDTLMAQKAKAEKEYNQIINKINGWTEMEEIGIIHTPSSLCPTEIERKILSHKENIASMLGNSSAIICTRDYFVDGSRAKGRKFQEAYGKNLLQGFNCYYRSKVKSITFANCNKTLELIEKAFEKYNKQSELLGISINKEYLNEILSLATLELDLKIAQSEEKEKIKQEKHKLKEQAKLLEEAERAKKKLAEERKQYELALAKTITLKEQEEIRAKLANIDKREADIDYRITQQKAGWLYIVSTPSMPNIVKIGCSRRLNPFERIKELSSASVPFPFVCHGLVFDEDIFALENKVHQYFNAKRVNNENKHKEFFKISPKEAIFALKNEFNCEVKFINEGDFE